MRKNIFHGIATLCLLGASAIDFTHNVLGRHPWTGFGEPSIPLSYFLIASWLIAIAGIWTKRSFSNFSMVIGIFLVLSQGIVVVQDASPATRLVFTALALVAAACIFGARYPSLVGEDRAVENYSRAA
jgi:hypothetical protein